MTNDRDGVVIRGEYRLHSTLRRDWVCGTCGSRLVTRWFTDAPHWHTVCANDVGHPADDFVHGKTWAYREYKRMVEAAQAQEVFAHLPPELQAAIVANS